jgi:hypothetical protein
LETRCSSHTGVAVFPAGLTKEKRSRAPIFPLAGGVRQILGAAKTVGRQHVIGYLDSSVRSGTLPTHGGFVKKPIHLLITLLLVAFARPQAEEIQLKDGSKIAGKVIGVNGETFLVKTNYGEINVPRSDIISITFPENTPKTASDDATPPPMDEELNGDIYTNRTAGFKISVPKGWKIAGNIRTKDVAAALDSSDETLLFMMTPEKFSGTLTTYKVLAEAQFQKNFSGYVKDSETDAELDGHKGVRIVWHGTSNANQAQLKFLVYILPYDARMVRLSFGTLSPLFDDAIPTFEKIAASYQSTAAKN